MGRLCQTQGSRATTRKYVTFKHQKFQLLISPTSGARQATQIWSHIVILSTENPESVNQHLKHWFIVPKLNILLQSMTFKSQNMLLESTSESQFNKVIHDLIIQIGWYHSISFKKKSDRMRTRNKKQVVSYLKNLHHFIFCIQN